MKPESQSNSANDPAACASVREALHDRWIKGRLRPQIGAGFSSTKESEHTHGEPSAPAGFRQHLRECSLCRSEADSLLQLDASLRQSFRLLGRSLPPTEERIQETLESLRDEAVEARLLSRLRRGLRIVLWAAFYGLILLALGYLLAIYKLLQW